MKKIFGIFILFLLMANLSACAKPVEGESTEASELLKKPLSIKTITEPSSDLKEPVDVLQVYYFHGTSRCNTCLKVGKYVQDIMENKFSLEINNGKIDYREINIDLPENKDLAKKFQASGSTLYLNAVRGEVDNIEKDLYAWRIVNDEAGFKTYLEERINSFLQN